MTVPAGDAERSVRRPVKGVDQAEFDALHRMYFDDLRRFVFRRVRDRQLAEDIAQETFLRAYRSRHAFDPARPVWPWLAAIARNLVINALRDAGRRHEASGGAGEWDAIRHQPDVRTDASPELSYISREHQRAISTALAALGPRQQRILMLRCWQGLSYEEIARAEGVSIDALKSLLKRARHSFRLTYAAITREFDTRVIVGWPLAWFVRHLRSKWARSKEGVIGTCNLASASPALQSLVEATAIVAAAAAIMLGSSTTPIESSDAVVNAPPKQTVRGRSDPTAAQSLTAQTELAADGVTAATEAHAVKTKVDASIRTNFHDDAPDRRTIGVNTRGRRPGSDEEEGSQTTIEVPCVFGDADPMCSAVDGVFNSSQGTGR